MTLLLILRYIRWVARQLVFYGANENKVSIMALAKLLEHGVNTNDARLQDINVQGDIVSDYLYLFMD